MTDPLRSSLLALYADEYREHLAALRDLFARGTGDLEEAYRHAHSLKGAARAVDLPAVVERAHGLETLVQAWWEGHAVPDDTARRQAQADLDAIEDVSAAAVSGRPAAATPEPAEPPAAAPSTVTVRVEADAAERLAADASRLMVELERQQRDRDALRRQQGALAAGPLRDQVIDLLRALDERDWAVQRAAEDTAADVVRLRQVTADAALGGFGPMLRMLAAERGRQVRFDAAGLDTRADRDVLAVVAEATGHLLRNAVVHGIEPPAVRRAAGKDPVGRVALAVAAVGPRLDVRVSDDGAGISTERLAAEAVARGLLTAAQAARAEPDRLRALVFHPGLSTAGALDTAAGRGMGMSIVRRLVDRLQGDIVLRSDPGNGTEVALSVPVSAMAQHVVLVRVRDQVFGLPALAVSRLVHVEEQALRSVEGGLAALVDGAELPLADLGSLLGLDGPPSTSDGACAVLMRVGDDLLGLVVDGVADVRPLAVSPLNPPLARDDRLAGTVVLEGGRLAIMLSPAGLRPSTVAGIAPGLRRPVAAMPPQVLVVDDSPTIRSLERAILEANSFRVRLAADGVEALARMAEAVPDAVVSDIEMPRMDGFGLLAAMRAEPALVGVPVVLVSSRAGPDERRRAEALGAAALLSKQDFDQGRFLAAVHGVIA